MTISAVVVITIICRQPDPHVSAVCTELAAIDTPFTIWDLAAPHHIALEIDPLIETEQRVFWWRYKSTAAQYQGTSDPRSSFVDREWLASLRALARLSSQSSVWVNHPLDTADALLKTYVLKAAEECGLVVPKSLVTNDPKRARTFFFEHGGDIVYKPLTYYYESPDLATFTTRVKLSDLDDHAEKLKVAPSLFQRRIEKAYELRITIVGDAMFAIRIDSQRHHDTELDWRRNQARRDMFQSTYLPRDLGDSLLKLHTKLGLVYGAYDVIVDRQQVPHFLEVNPGGQWLWLEQATGVPIARALARLLRSADLGKSTFGLDLA